MFKKLNKMKIGARLKKSFRQIILIFGILSALVVVIMLYTINNYGTILDNYAYPQGDIAMAMNESAEVRAASRGIVGYDSDSLIESMKEQHEQAVKSFEEYLEKIRPTMITKEGTACMDAIDKAWAEYKEVDAKVIEVGATTDTAKSLQAQQMMTDEAAPKYQALDDALQKLMALNISLGNAKLAHHMGAYFEMFKRDRQRLDDIYERMNYCPLGSGALAGTTYPLDRAYTAELLDFDGPTLNSMDSVADRDYVIELLAALSTIMMHLSRFCEEIIIWNSNEYRFVEIDDAYSTGSSIMPQKKNPDIAELVRGKTGRVYGALMSILTTMKGIPLAYNKDMQEDKELTFDAIDTVKGCIALFTGMLRTMKFNRDIMKVSAMKGFTNATDAADYLVNHGVPFRDAHGIIGRLVLYCIEQNKAIDELSLEELKSISPVFEQDIYDAISLETCVNKRTTIGAPGSAAMKEVIRLNQEYLKLS